MSAPAFTAGPWNVQGDGQIWCDDHPIVEKLCSGPWGDEGVDIITGEELLVHWWGTVATDEAKANANLIAAAPEQYSELEEVCEAIRELRLSDGHAARTGDESRFDRALAQVCQHENRIRILLARARGQS